MRSFGSGAHRARQVLPLLGAGLLLCLFFALYAPAVPVAAQADFIRVPGDADSIQAAIDLAEPGAEIRVQGGDYSENLVISKTLRLSGSWSSDFSVQDVKAPTILDAGGRGRAVTIGGGEVPPSVVISYFAITGGSAAGLGGAVTPTLAGGMVLDLAAAPSSGAAAGLGEQTTALRGQLAELAAHGLFPGGQAALDALLVRAEAGTDLQWETPASLAPAAVTVNGEIDCGGGVYVKGAALQLMTVDVSSNIAAAAGSGAGGGLCAVDIPAGGLVLQKVTLGGNVASQDGAGFGGGLFLDGGATPAAGALQINNVRMDNNTASKSGAGYGGGAFLTDAPGVQLELGMFGSNYASRTGLRGYGGGVYLHNSADAVMNLVGFENNTGVNVPLIGSDDWPIGEGGALYVDQSPNLSITSPGGNQGRSLFVGNLGALRGVGFGGALSVHESPGLQIEQTDFLGNWAVIYPDGAGDTTAGGAIHLSGAAGTRISGSTFRNNIAGVFNLGGNNLYGGALSAGSANHLSLVDNSFQENSCGTSSSGGLAHGGGVQIGASNFITITGNTFTGNAADLGLSGGFGGALHLIYTNDVQIAHNHFERNRGGTGAGIGGAVTVEASGATTGFGWFTAETAGAGVQAIDDPLVERVTIHANTFSGNRAAAAEGGEQANLGGALALSSINGLKLANNVLAANDAANGAAITLFGWNRATITATVADAAMVNNTLFNNEGDSGVYIEGWTTPLTLTNNIVVSHTVGIVVGDNKVTGGTAVEARYNLYNANGADWELDVSSRLTETGKITGSVLFVEPWQGNFGLKPQSAAVDAGDPAGVPPAPAVDIDDTPRPFGPAVDVGAYEWHGPVYNNYLPGIFKEACKTQPVEGWALGEVQQTQTTILHTTDGGLTWSRQYTATVLLNGLAVGDRLHLWSVGNDATILHSADGGVTWQRQQLPSSLPATALIIRVTAINAGTAWAAAKAGDGANNTAYILKTMDGGATWSVQASIDTGPGWINWIDAADADNIWAVGNTSTSLAGQGAAAEGDGFIYHSRDGGRTWRLELEAPLGPVIGVDAVSAQVAWAAGRQGAFRTLDGGTTWEFFDLVALADLNHVDSIDGGQVWVSGDSFTVLYTDRGLAQPLPTNAWQNRSPAPLQNKVAFTVDFIDAKNGWIAGGTFGSSPSGVVARTCDGGLSWEVSRWEDLDPIRTVQMVPPGR